MTVQERISSYPPVLCRLLARHQRRQGRRYFVRAMTVQEISRACGIKPATIEWLSTLTTWDQVPFGVVFRFARGCGVDFNDPAAMRRQRDILRKNNGRMMHWADDPKLDRLLRIWVTTPIAA